MNVILKPLLFLYIYHSFAGYFKPKEDILHGSICITITIVDIKAKPNSPIRFYINTAKTDTFILIRFAATSCSISDCQVG